MGSSPAFPAKLLTTSSAEDYYGEGKNSEKAVKPNIFMRLGLFIKQIIDELRKVVTPTSKELFFWALAVFIFVLLLMALVTGMDYGLGKLTLWIFG